MIRLSVDNVLLTNTLIAGSVEKLKKMIQESIKVSLIAVNNIIVKKVSLKVSLIAVNVIDYHFAVNETPVMVKLVHHRCCRIIHAELGRLASTKWRFICINGEKTLKTIWNELEVEFLAIFNNCSVQLLENTATVQVGHHPLTVTEETIALADCGTNDQTDLLLRSLQKKRKEENLSFSSLNA